LVSQMLSPDKEGGQLNAGLGTSGWGNLFMLV
jgi:hypothetical protein